jgi:hypothetical protein
MKRKGKRLLRRSVVESSIRIMKMTHSRIVNGVNLGVVVSECAVSQYKGEGSRKGGRHVHDRSLGVYSVFWAKRVTPRKHMECSPYFAITGAHPILPFDIAEATYLQPLPTSVMSSTDLISRRAIALQKRCANVNALYSKVYQARLKAVHRFEQQHLRTLKDFDFQRGSLVLMCNTQIEKSLNTKMHARYIGPLIVVSHNYGGAYILSELDGTVLHRPIAAVVNSVLLPSIALNCLPGCCTRMFNCSGILGGESNYSL